MIRRWMPLRPFLFALVMGAALLACAAPGLHAQEDDDEEDEVKANLKILLDEKADVDDRIDAAGELGFMEEEAASAVPKMLPLIEHPQVGPAVIEAFGDMGSTGKPAVPQIMKVLETSKSEDHRYEAVWALGGIGYDAKESVPLLTKCLDDEKLRSGAAWSLAMMGPHAKPAVPELRKYVASDDLKLRKNVILAFAEIGAEGKEAAPDLLAALKKETDERQRLQILMALGAMGASYAETQPHLLEALKSSDRRTRLAAVRALGNYGQEAAGTKDQLTALMQGDADGNVKVAAMMALTRILPDAPARVAILIDQLKRGGGMARLAARSLVGQGEAALEPLEAYLKGLPENDNSEAGRMGRAALSTLKNRLKHAGGEAADGEDGDDEE